MGPQKSIFFNGLSLGARPVCFDISRYLADEYFDMCSLGVPPPKGPPQTDPKKSIF